MTNKKIIILGAGITGLSTGSFLVDKNYNVLLLEKEPIIGGMSNSFKYKNTTLDFGPHKLYSQLPGIMEEFERIIGKNNLLTVTKKNSIRLAGKYFDFPVSIPRVVLGINPIKSFKLGVGFGLVTTKNIFHKKKNITYEDYFISGFGKPAYNMIFRDVASKLWGHPLQLSEELARKRVPIPNILELLKSSSGKDSSGRELSAKYFYYPKNGGIGLISNKYLDNIQSKRGKLQCSITIDKINVNKKSISTVNYSANGKKYVENADFFVSTIYLKDLLNLLNPKPPQKILNVASKLKYRSLILIYIFVNKQKIMKDNWIFFPEKEYIFNRISEHNSFSKYNVEKGKAILTAEITCDTDSDIYNSSDEYIFRRTIEDLEKANILKETEVSEYLITKSERIYPVYDLNYKKNLNIILEYLDSINNLITLGRQGLYNYNNIDHCIDMSIKGVEYIDFYFKNPHINSIKKWDNTRRTHFENYRIVD